MRTEAKCWLLLTDVRVSIDVCQQGQSRKEAQTRWWTETLGVREKISVSFCLRARAPSCTGATGSRGVAIYCRAAECNASSKGSKSSGRLLGFGENYGNAGEMDEQHFITINQRLLINKVHFLFSMIQGIIKRTLSLSF